MSRASSRDGSRVTGTRTAPPLLSSTLDRLREVVGAGHCRPALAADAIDGVMPAAVVEPGSAAEVAATLRLAAAAELAVVPRGGGTKLGWGAPPSRADLVLSTARLDQVLEHAAGDLVVRAQAGVRLDALQEKLAEAGQWLALDPPEPGATLGGVVAAAASGPRRHRYGTARDLLIGVGVALCDGSVAKAGGKVVKNVAGYDLCRLFSGSFGTLGVIVETTFRLHPLSASRSVVSLVVDTPRAVGDAVQSLLCSPLVPSAVELSWPDAGGAGMLTVLFEGVPAGVSAQARQAASLLAAHGHAKIAADDVERDPLLPASSEGQSPAARMRPTGLDAQQGFARDTRLDAHKVSERHTGRDGQASAVVRLSSVPTLVPEAMEGVLAAAHERSLGARIDGRAGLGVLLATLDGDEAGLAAAVLDLRRELSPPASVVLRDAPPGVKRAAGVWGDPGDALALMRRVKGRFDPRGTLSPGRFVGGM